MESLRPIRRNSNNPDLAGGLRVGCITPGPASALPVFHIGKHLANIFPQHQLRADLVVEMKPAEGLLPILTGGNTAGVTQRNHLHGLIGKSVKSPSGENRSAQSEPASLRKRFWRVPAATRPLA